ncbi:S-antigen protein-like [Ceratobasidium sp. AG-Ba]|nr:S-antigen protein-like [Ceratobasidium sp. AG-Ba]
MRRTRRTTSSKTPSKTSRFSKPRPIVWVLWKLRAKHLRHSGNRPVPWLRGKDLEDWLEKLSIPDDFALMAYPVQECTVDNLGYRWPNTYKHWWGFIDPKREMGDSILILRLPCDVVVDHIFPHLGVKDMLSFSVVSKPVHLTLWGVAFKGMWVRIAEENDIPKAPSGVHATYWLWMIHMPYCTNCGAMIMFLKPMDPKLFMRLCAKCFPKCVVPWRSISNQEVKQVIVSSTYSLKSPGNRNGTEYCRRSHVQEGSELWAKAQQQESESSREEWEAWKAKQGGMDKPRLLAEWQAGFKRRAKEAGYDIEQELLLESRNSLDSILSREFILNECTWAWGENKLVKLLLDDIKTRQHESQLRMIIAVVGPMQSDTDGLVTSIPHAPPAKAARLLSKWKPMPSLAEVCKLAVVIQWRNMDIPLHEIEPIFELEWKDKVVQAIEDWRAKMKHALATSVRTTQVEMGLPSCPPRLQLLNVSSGGAERAELYQEVLKRIDEDSDTDSDTGSDADSDTGSDTGSDTNSGTNSGTDSGADSDTNSGADSDTDSGADSDTDSGANSDTDSGANSDTDSGADSDTDSDTNSGANFDTNSGADFDTNSGANFDTNSDTNSHSDAGEDKGEDTGAEEDPAALVASDGDAPEVGASCQVTAGGNGDLHMEFDEDTNTLLHAATIFCVVVGDSARLFTYDGLVQGLHNKTRDGLALDDLSRVKLHGRISLAAREVLTAAGYQDATCVELNMASFKCGCCNYPYLSGVVSVVMHFVEAKRLHSRIESQLSVLEEQKLTYTYGHDPVSRKGPSASGGIILDLTQKLDFQPDSMHNQISRHAPFLALSFLILDIPVQLLDLCAL